MSSTRKSKRGPAKKVAKPAKRVNVLEKFIRTKNPMSIGDGIKYMIEDHERELRFLRKASSELLEEKKFSKTSAMAHIGRAVEEQGESNVKVRPEAVVYILEDIVRNKNLVSAYRCNGDSDMCCAIGCFLLHQPLDAKKDAKLIDLCRQVATSLAANKIFHITPEATRVALAKLVNALLARDNVQWTLERLNHLARK